MLKTISANKVRANRENAQRSRGPRTAGGKARAATNAYKHGLTATKLVLPLESAPEFDAFMAAARAELNPGTMLESYFADRAIYGMWRLHRGQVIEAEAISDAMYTRPSAIDPVTYEPRKPGPRVLDTGPYATVRAFTAADRNGFLTRHLPRYLRRIARDVTEALETVWALQAARFAAEEEEAEPSDTAVIEDGTAASNSTADAAGGAESPLTTNE